MYKLFAILIIGAVILPLHAIAYDKPHNQEWSHSVGVGAIALPHYLGDDDYRVLILPNFNITYSDKFFASLFEGVGFNVINNDHWRIGLIGKYDFGREEDGSNPFLAGGDETDDLKGLGDVDDTVEVGGFAEFTWNFIMAKVEIRQGVGGHEGLIGEAKVEYTGNTQIYQKPVFYSVGPAIKYAGSNYNEAFFGVNAKQSANSGLAQYNADAGLLTYGVGGSVVVALTKRVSTILFASFNQLGEEAADSSLVKERGSDQQAMIGLFINYGF